jgi:hypothetical protein
MNQNFKIKMFAILATISGPAIAPCFALQDTEQLDETKSNEIAIVRPIDIAPSNAFGAIRAATPVPKQSESTLLPPIVTEETGTNQNFAPPIFVAPPIVQGEAVYTKPVPAPQVEPQVLQLPPIVVAGANDTFSVPDNTPNSALPIPNAMPLSPLAPLVPTAELAEETTNETPENAVGAPRVPSDLILMEIPAPQSTLAETELETADDSEVAEVAVPAALIAPEALQENSVVETPQVAPPTIDLPIAIAPEVTTTPEIAKPATLNEQPLPGAFVEPVESPKQIVDTTEAKPAVLPPVDTELRKIEKVEPNTASQITENPNVGEKAEQTKDTSREEISQAAKWNPGQASDTLSKAGVPLYATPKQEPVVIVEKSLPPIVAGQSLSELNTTPQAFVPEIVQGEANNIVEIVKPSDDVTTPVKNAPSVAPDSSSRQLPAIVQGNVLPPRAPTISPQSVPVPPSRELMVAEPAPIAPPKALAITAEQTSSPEVLPETLPESLQTPVALPVVQTTSPTLLEEDYKSAAASPPVTAPAPTRVARQTKETPTYFNTLPGEQSRITSTVDACLGCSGDGCPECGVMMTAEADYAGCQSCGSGGCFDSGTVAARFGNSGSVSSARKYFIFDAIYLDRYDGTIAISNFGGLNNFENNLFGARVTIGRREDAANGDELSYFGSAELSESASHTDPLGRISVGFPSTGAFAIETTAFRNATEQSQSKSTMFQSIEYNRNDWGWDVVRTFVGLRYIYIQDEYQISSTNLAGETGDFELSTQNNLLGGHLGYELFYDVGYRLSWSTIGKFGVYANPNRVKTKLNNAGAQFLDLTDTNTAFSGTIELGLNGHYKLGKRSRLRFGYNAFWLGEVASTADNIPVTINPTTGSDTSDSDDMFFHGLSLGLEMFR